MIWLEQQRPKPKPKPRPKRVDKQQPLKRTQQPPKRKPPSKTK
jgi:hypothetical protein